MGLKVLLSVVLICLGLVVHSGQTYFYVMKVYSGDRIRVVDIDGKQFDVRLCGIDAPEVGQPFGKESTKYLMQMVQKKKFVHMEGLRFFKDGSAESTAILHSIHTSDTENINRSMIESGMAWDVSKDSRYANEQRDAKKEHLGLWGSFPQVRPSEWRKNHPSELASISAEESNKLIPSETVWVRFLERVSDPAEDALRELPNWGEFKGWGELSIKSLFGVELGMEFKDLPFQSEKIKAEATLFTYGRNNGGDSYAFTPKKLFRGFKDYRLIRYDGRVYAIRAEIVTKHGVQFEEDVETLKKILECKFGVPLKKVPNGDWFVFKGSGKDYSMLRLGSPKPHVLMIELKIDGGRFNDEMRRKSDDEWRRKKESEKRLKEKDSEIKARKTEQEEYNGIDAL